MAAGRRYASTRVDSRDPLVDSALMAGGARAAVEVRGPARRDSPLGRGHPAEKRLRLLAKRASVLADVIDTSERMRVPAAASAEPGRGRRARPRLRDRLRGGSLGVVGYQDPAGHRVTTIDPGGCVPARGDHSVNVISQTSMRRQTFDRR